MICSISGVPLEILIMMFGYCAMTDIYQFQFVSKRFYGTAESESRCSKYSNMTRKIINHEIWYNGLKYENLNP